VVHERPPAVLLEKLRWRETRTQVQEYSENFKRKMVQGASVRWEGPLHPVGEPSVE